MTDRITSKLIRLQCDGELTAEQVEQVRQCLDAHPEDRAGFDDQLKFEKRLRECVSAAMASSARCPEALRQSISIAISEEEIVAAEPVRRWSNASLFWSPRRANIFAIAATLAVIAGAILYGIFGTSIDDVRQTPVDLVANAAVFASRAHETSAADDGQLNRAGDARLVRQAEEDMTKLLNLPVRVFDLSDLQYEFVGASQANLPLAGPSGRMIYRSNRAGERKPRVSVFFARFGDQDREAWLSMTPLEWYPISGNCKHKVMCINDRKLIVLVVCCDERDLQAVVQRLTLAKD